MLLNDVGKEIKKSLFEGGNYVIISCGEMIILSEEGWNLEAADMIMRIF